MPNRILIQQASGDVKVPVPWPILVDLDGTVITGRPDAHALIGFQSDPTVQHLDVPFLTILPDSLHHAIGKYPVFSNKDGKSGLFVITQPVASIDYYGKD